MAVKMLLPSSLLPPPLRPGDIAMLVVTATPCSKAFAVTTSKCTGTLASYVLSRIVKMCLGMGKTSPITGRGSDTETGILIVCSAKGLRGDDILPGSDSQIKSWSRKVRDPKDEAVTLGSSVRDGEIVFGVAQFFASFNGTFVHVTELSGREILVLITGGMKADGKESPPYAAMLAAQDVTQRCKLRVTGGNKTKTPGPGAQSALRALARSGMKISVIEDVTPIPTDSYSQKGGQKVEALGFAAVFF